MALDGITREYPYHLSHVVMAPGVIESPRSLVPVFYGCFDWHSAVHGHWLLVRACRVLEPGPFVDACRAALDAQLTAENLLVERDYLAVRPGFERPYGLAWLLILAAELEADDDPVMQRWREALRPLEQVAADHIANWLPKLSHPVRSGTHNQTAFAMVLVLDWAATTGNQPMQSIVRERARDFYGDDADSALHMEPSGEDFLSPALGSAWIMSRVLGSDALSSWVDRAMPRLARGVDFVPVCPSDRSDGRLCHLDGLNLSRAWMLRDLADALPRGDARCGALRVSADQHRTAGLQGIESEYYTASHWLGTFAAFLETRSIPRSKAID